MLYLEAGTRNIIFKVLLVYQYLIIVSPHSRGLISSFTHTYGLHGDKTILKAIYPLKFVYHPLINKLINKNNSVVYSS